MKTSRILTLAALFALASSCSLNIDPTTAPEMNQPVAAFLESVDHGRMDEAWAQLATSDQQRLDRPSFVRAGNDFRRICDLFLNAGISTRAGSPKSEFTVVVKNFDGHQGVVRFVMTRDSGRWLIANVLPEPPQ